MFSRKPCCRLFPPVMSKPAKKIRIHGDNIVECERAVALICDAMGAEAGHCVPEDSLSCPKYTVSTPQMAVSLELFPGFRRWDQDILSVVRLQGGMLREAADVIITEVAESNRERILLAFEFCAALPAGNQA